MRRALKLCFAALAIGLFSSVAYGQRHDRNSYLGQTPPEIVSEREHWAGTVPPSLAELKGKVVWLHFNY
jgi:hypothetical protein